jgi:diguanylate cyclase (GGDEF)-like protein
VSVHSVEALLETCPVRVLGKDDLLLHQGEPNRSMYMVLSGRLSVHLESESNDPVATIAAGETVGELSVIDERPASAFVRAAEPTRLLVVDEERFWELVERSHEFAVNLVLLLARRLRSNNATVSENIRLQREYKRNALIDGLTALYNRRWLDDTLPRYVARYGRDRRPLSILMVDIDLFKRVNDTYGHPVGDVVLFTVAQTLRHHIRPGDFAARYGGEEFLVILADSDEHGAVKVGERLRAAVSRATVRTGDADTVLTVTISVGAARLLNGQKTDELIVAADAALYESKRLGRNRVTLSPHP